ncbi:MAG: HD family phosphohydrolase, partial [Clostridium sp.]|nr:HD family phosphohydrolase [Clostridium sp.]
MEPSGLYEYTSDQEYMECVKDILEHPVFQSMDQYIQHGTTTCKTHCIQVSYLGYKFCKRFGGNWRSAARAGLLHDLFLYDWHTHARETGKHFHGFTHPREALRNADRYFNLSWEEEMIILRHMWPLTPVPPVTKAGYAITCADKLCSTLETTARFKRWLMMCFFAQPARR